MAFCNRCNVSYILLSLLKRRAWEPWHLRPLSQALRNGHLKRSSSAFWVDRAATFQVEFTWNPCTIHGRHGRAPESPCRKSPAGRTSSTGRALPPRVASTAEEVQGDEYFEVEDIWDWRLGEEGREYFGQVGKGMGTRTVLASPLRISSNVLRFCSSSTRGRDCLQPLECEFDAEFRDV